MQRGFIRLHVLGGFLALLTIACACVWGWVQFLESDLPQTITILPASLQSTSIVDSRGNELYRIFRTEDRTDVRGSDISPFMKQAIVAIEDERFYDRPLCIDVIGIARALMANLKENDVVQGGSTITQQLARLLFLTNEKTYSRKVRETLLACRIESAMSRDAILTAYLNRVPFGGTVYGVEQAAHTYFGVSAHDLTLAQAAALAGMPQRPSVYTNPQYERTLVDHGAVRDIRSGKRTVASLKDNEYITGLLGRSIQTPTGIVWVEGRAETVVRAMYKVGFITDAQQTATLNAVHTLKLNRTRYPIDAPYFVESIREQLNTLRTQTPLLAETGAALRVRTTLMPDLQSLAESVLNSSAAILSKAGAQNAAMVVIDRKTRSVVAYVGNIDSADTASEVDMARAPRQPGSSFKPIVYSAYFANTGASSGSFLLDEPLPTEFGSPKNYDGQFDGWISAKRALATSRNIPAIKAFLQAGGEDVILRLAAALGAKTPLHSRAVYRGNGIDFSYGWPAAIGSAELPLIELVQAYASIADGGRFQTLRMIDGIDRADGSPVFTIPRSYPSQVLDPRAANEVHRILSDEKLRPAGYWRDKLTIPGFVTGAKTGTSNMCLQRGIFGKCVSFGISDVWTVGYDDRLVVGVWVGNADRKPLTPESDGITVAAPIWHAFLEQAHALLQ